MKFRESIYNVWSMHENYAYVFNGVSGGLLRITKSQYMAVKNFLSSNNPNNLDSKLLSKLAHGLIIVPVGSDEVTLLSKKYLDSKDNTSHFSLTIVPSIECNFDCIYCFEDNVKSRINEKYSTAILALLDSKLSTVKSCSVFWYGGEPLIAKGQMFNLSTAFINRCESAEVDYSASITTNGYLLDESMCKKLKAHRILSAQVSIDGPPLVHNQRRPLRNGRGTYSQIIKNLHFAVKHLSVSIRVNVDKRNIDSIEELLDLLASEGFAGKIHIYLGQVFPIFEGGKSNNCTDTNKFYDIEEFSDVELKFSLLLQRHGFNVPMLPRPIATPCTAVRNNDLIIGSNGELYKCWESVGNIADTIGNLLALKSINCPPNKWINYNPFQDPQCISCIALPVCMGGCVQRVNNDEKRISRCSTFRFTYKERVRMYIESQVRH